MPKLLAPCGQLCPEVCWWLPFPIVGIPVHLWYLGYINTFFYSFHCLFKSPKCIHQISYPSNYATRQTVQCQPHDGPGHDGAAGHDGFQAPHPGVSICEVCHLGNDAHQPQIPGWVCQDLDQARPGQAEGASPPSQGAPSRRPAGQIMGSGHGPPCTTKHRCQGIWQNGCQNHSLSDSQAENVQGGHHL